MKCEITITATCVSFSVLLFGCGSPGDTWFSEEATSRGVDFVHHSGFREKHYLPEIMAGGGALIDVNNDGLLDIYLVQSGSLYADAVPVPNRLYLNQGNGSFRAVRGNGGAGDTGYGMGVAAGDFNNDGAVDLYVTNVGPNVLYQNDGQGQFTDVSAQAGVDDPNWGSSAAFADLDSDGDLDLYVANYMHWNMNAELDCDSGGIPTYCSPTSYARPAMDRLYRNNGDGTFTNVTEDAGINTQFGNGLGVVTSDFNNDGRLDIFIANDMTPNQLWINQGELRFKNQAMQMGAAIDGYGVTKAGMGVVSEDFDGDGDYDILVCNLVGQTDSYFRNEGSYFSDATAELGLNSVTRRFTRFGAVFADFNNDSVREVYIVNGAVGLARKRSGDLYAEPNTLLQRSAQGTFEEAFPIGGTEKLFEGTSRGLVAGDVNNDGGVDLLVVNRDAPPFLLINQRAGHGNWLILQLHDTNGRDAYGAELTAVVGEARIFVRVRPEGSYLSSSDPRLHIGLGTQENLEDVLVRWPTGEIEDFGDQDANQVTTLEFGTGVSASWPIPARVSSPATGTL